MNKIRKFGMARFLTGLLFVLATCVMLTAVSAEAAAPTVAGTGNTVQSQATEAAGIQVAQAQQQMQSAAKAMAAAAEPKKEPTGVLGFLLGYLADNPFAFLFIALALGYPLGRVAVKGVTLGATAGTLVVAIVLALAANALYGLNVTIPGLVQDIFLMFFMYALGMRVGPQFFSGLARGGLDFVMIGLIVVFSNFLIVFFGVKAVGLDPGYAAGIISGSYTVTAVMGVAQSAISSGAFQLPAGMTADVVSANMAAGYAISYVLSSLTIILFIKYLPSMFGHDPVKSAQEAEASFQGAGTAPLPGTAGTSLLGFTDQQIRSYKVEKDELVGQSVQALYAKYPRSAVLKVVRGDEVIDAQDNPTIQQGDIVGVAGQYGRLMAHGTEIVGSEVDEPRARNIDIEVADLVVGKSEYAGKTLRELGEMIGFGVYLKAMFRAGTEFPAHPETVVEKGDVLRLAGPAWCVAQAAKSLNSKPLIESAYTEVSFMAAALTLGFIIGKLSVAISGIPFALGTSAGCMLMGIFVSWLRTRNPAFGGPTSEGARSFLNDIGLSLFVAVLGATVGPKILGSLHGTVVIWIAILGLAGALIPPFLAWLYGYYIRKMNPVILAGGCAGGRNSTPALNGIQDQSRSAIAAIAYPVPYALTSAIVLILGYIAMVFS